MDGMVLVLQVGHLIEHHLISFAADERNCESNQESLDTLIFSSVLELGPCMNWRQGPCPECLFELLTKLIHLMLIVKTLCTASTRTHCPDTTIRN